MKLTEIELLEIKMEFEILITQREMFIHQSRYMLEPIPTREDWEILVRKMIDLRNS